MRLAAQQHCKAPTEAQIEAPLTKQMGAGLKVASSNLQCASQAAKGQGRPTCKEVVGQVLGSVGACEGCRGEQARKVDAQHGQQDGGRCDEGHALAGRDDAALDRLVYGPLHSTLELTGSQQQETSSGQLWPRLLEHSSGSKTVATCVRHVQPSCSRHMQGGHEPQRAQWRLGRQAAQAPSATLLKHRRTCRRRHSAELATTRSPNHRPQMGMDSKSRRKYYSILLPRAVCLGICTWRRRYSAEFATTRLPNQRPQVRMTNRLMRGNRKLAFA